MATCNVIGRLIRADGQPIAGAFVRAKPISARNTPIYVANDLITDDPIETTTNEDGSFNLTVVRGLTVVITIDAEGFSKQVNIPDAASVNLKDL